MQSLLPDAFGGRIAEFIAVGSAEISIPGVEPVNWWISNVVPGLLSGWRRSFHPQMVAHQAAFVILRNTPNANNSISR
jgi:hypothetical protein